MTPKEKAKEISIKFCNSTDVIKPNFGGVKDAIKCVDEIILANPHSNPFNTDVYSTMDYWQDVKEELEKL